MNTLNPLILEALETHDIKFVGNSSDMLSINIESLLMLLDTVFEYGETQGYATGFYEAEDEAS